MHAQLTLTPCLHCVAVRYRRRIVYIAECLTCSLIGPIIREYYIFRAGHAGRVTRMTRIVFDPVKVPQRLGPLRKFD